MDRSLRVLHVEDSEQDVALLTGHLSRAGYELISERVETPAEMGAALETQEWDVILCDYPMPHFNALRALDLLKEMELDLPFIIISDTIGEAVAVEAMRAGAHDYLMKDNLVRLAPTIERELQEANNRRARRHAEEALKASEAELRALFEAMTDVILVFDSEGRHLKVAPTNPAHVHVPAAHRIGKTVHEVFPRATADLFLACISAALTEGQMKKLEYRLPIEGTEIWFEASVSPFSGDTTLWIARDVTERKRAEEEKAQLTAQMESQRQRLNNIVASVPGVVWEAWGEPDSATQRIDFVSDYIETMLGYSVEEWLSTPNFWLSIVHPNDKEQAALEAAASFASRSNFTTAFRWIAKDGRAVWVESKFMVITDVKGLPVGLRGVTTDISERKQAEEQLRRQLDFNEAIMTSLGEGVYAVDKSGRVTFMNPAAEIALGWTEGELLGQEMHEVIHFQHADGTPRPAEECPLLGVLRSGHTINIEDDIFTRRDGSMVPVSYTSSPIITGGQVVGAVLASRDITERKRAEETLLQSEERYRLLFERNPQPMWVFDLETLAFLEVNDAAIHHYGYSREEFLAMTIKDIRPPQDIPNLLTNISGVTPQHEEAGIWKHKKKDGTIIDVEIAAHELTFYGRLAQIVLAFDVTERRTLEEQLRQSQKMEAVGRLAGGIAHDFNNLLTVINGYSELTLRRLQPEDALTCNIEEIKRAGSRAASLTRQLLAFSRKQVLQPKVLDLNAVISDLERMLQRLIGEDIDLQTVLKPGLRRVNADPGQIEQVIMNLVVNARDAIPDGGKLIIETENVYLTEDYARHHVAVKPGPYVMLAVSDNGLGMNDETKARLFEPFFTTKDLGKGTGLGLSTVYGIVKQSMGNIRVYSEVGLGTTFKVYLPCVDDEVDNRQPSQTSQPIALGSETVLLIEDDEMVRGLTRTTLEEGGYKVLQAANGAEAVLICEQYREPIQLLLTDVVMPGMSGCAVADRLKTLRPQMLVLYMSGYTEDAIVHRGVLNEGVNFIEKPFVPAALTRKVREVLDAA